MCPSTDSPDVLLSYAPEDAEWTENWLLPRLEKQGLHAFLVNRDLLAGGTRLQQLAEQIANVRHTLLVLSPDWVTNLSETFTGLFSHSTDPLGQQRKTIPLLCKTCTPPYSLARLVSANFTPEKQDEWEQEFARLLAVLQGQQYRTAWGPPLGTLLGLKSPTNFIFKKNDHFVGREKELAELHELLNEPTPPGTNVVQSGLHTSSHLAGLTGLGGVGKTQLVVEYIYRYGESYPGGVFWVNAADSVADGLAKIGKVICGDGQDKNYLDLIQIAASYLCSDPDTLLVLDNLNDPALLNQPAAGIVIPLSLPCRLLFTTRRKDLRELPTIAVDVLAETDALKLLLRARPQILDGAHPEHSMAVQVCATLGKLPLAIELAAAFLGQEDDVTIAGYLKRLGKHGTLDTVDSHEKAEGWSDTLHNDLVRVTLRSQWEAVTDAKAHLLLQTVALMPEAEAIPVPLLGLLSGLDETAEEGFPAPLASAIRHLHNYSLLERLEKGKQVRLHPLIREFARTQVTDLPVFTLQCAANMSTALEDMLRVNKEILERGVDALLADLQSVLNLCPANAQLQELRFVLDKEAHNLRKPFYKEFPAYILQQVRTRALNLQKTSVMKRAEAALGVLKAPWFRKRFPTSRESPALLRTFAGHTSGINNVVLTPDGKYILSGSYDNTLRLWNLESGQCLRTFEGHTKSVERVGITQDGKHILSASQDTTLRLWDMESGQTLKTFIGHTGRVDCMAVIPTGILALSASIDNTIRLWDLVKGKCLYVFRDDEDRYEHLFMDVAITPDGKRAIFASGDETLRLWDIERGKFLYTYEGHTGLVSSVVITPNGKHVISASDDKTMRLWDIESGQTLRIFKGHTREINSMSFTPDGKQIVSTSEDRTFRLWNMESGECKYTFDGPPQLDKVQFTLDGKYVVFSSGWDLLLWDINYQSPYTFEGHASKVYDIAITSDGQRAISASEDNTLRVWDTESGQSLHHFKGHTLPVNGVAITPDGKHALSASWDNTMRLWSMKSNRCQKVFKGHGNKVKKVVILSDSKHALSTSVDKTLRLWDIASGKCLRIFNGHSKAVTGVATMPDGKHVISSSTDRSLRLWELKSAKCIRTFEENIGFIGVAITPDGKYALTTALSSSDLHLWDLKSNQKPITLKKHKGGAYDIVVTMDGKKIISVGSEPGMCLWDLENQQVLQVFIDTRLLCIAIDKSGSLIAVGDRTGAVHFIDYVNGDQQN